MELSVLNIAGQETGRKIVLDDAIFLEFSLMSTLSTLT